MRSVTYRNTFPDPVSPGIRSVEKVPAGRSPPAVPTIGSNPVGGIVKLPAQLDKRCHWRLRIWPIESDGRLTATRLRRNHRELSIQTHHAVEALHPQSGGGGGNRTRVQKTDHPKIYILSCLYLKKSSERQSDLLSCSRFILGRTYQQSVLPHPYCSDAQSSSDGPKKLNVSSLCC